MGEAGARKKDVESGQQEETPLKKQASNLSQNNEEAKQEAKSRNCAILVTALLVLFFGLFTLFTWLALRPVHSPKYYIDNVQINTFTMDTSATNSTTLSADFAFTVTARNENRKMDFKYDWITIDASYGGSNFGRSFIAGFKLGKRSNAIKTAAFKVGNVTLPQEKTNSLNAAIQNGSTVPLRVYAKAKIHVKIGTYVSFPVNVDVDCKLVVMAPPSPSNSVANYNKVVSKVCRLTRPPYKKARKFKSYRPVTYRH